MQLLPHRRSAPGPVRAFDGTARYRTDGALHFTWRLTGGIAQLRVPDAAPAGRADKLWHHTCFEAFIGDPHSSGYVELNFSPSSQWQVYGFRDYRTGMATMPVRNGPEIHWHRTDDELVLDAVFRMDDLPGPPGPRPPVPVRVGMTAVIEHLDGSFSWWAFSHPSAEPDFHNAASYLLAVDPRAAPGPAA